MVELSVLRGGLGLFGELFRLLFHPVERDSLGSFQNSSHSLVYI
jgi:hypothetical protein